MHRSTCLLLAAVAALVPGAASAQTQRSGGGSPNSQMMQQYQQLSAERVALQSENQRLKQEAADAAKQLEALRKERDALKAKSAHADGDVAQARAARETSEAALAKSRQQMDELIARFRETAAQLRTAEEDRARLQQAVTSSGHALDACTVANAGLFQLNGEVLDRWEKEGFFAALGRQESFFRLKRTELENLVDGYRDRAEQLKLHQAAPAPKTPDGAAPHGMR